MSKRGLKMLKKQASNKSKKMLKKQKRHMMMTRKSLFIIFVLALTAFVLFRNFCMDIADQFVADKYEQFKQLSNGLPLNEVNKMNLHRHHHDKKEKLEEAEEVEEEEPELIEEEDDDEEEEEGIFTGRKTHKKRCPLKEVSFENRTMEQAQMDLKQIIDRQMIKFGIIFIVAYLIFSCITKKCLRKLMKLNKRIVKESIPAPIQNQQQVQHPVQNAVVYQSVAQPQQNTYIPSTQLM